MPRITIYLKDVEKNALCTLAEKEFREPSAQAALIIRQELDRSGFLNQVLSIETEKCSNSVSNLQ